MKIIASKNYFVEISGSLAFINAKWCDRWSARFAGYNRANHTDLSRVLGEYVKDVTTVVVLGGQWKNFPDTVREVRLLSGVVLSEEKHHRTCQWNVTGDGTLYANKGDIVQASGHAWVIVEDPDFYHSAPERVILREHAKARFADQTAVVAYDDTEVNCQGTGRFPCAVELHDRSTCFAQAGWQVIAKGAELAPVSAQVTPGENWAGRFTVLYGSGCVTSFQHGVWKDEYPRECCNRVKHAVHL